MFLFSTWYQSEVLCGIIISFKKQFHAVWVSGRYHHMQYVMHMGLLFYFVCTSQKKLKLEKEAEALAAQDDGDKYFKVFWC